MGAKAAFVGMQVSIFASGVSYTGFVDVFGT
jgi:hypothetical protein